MSDKSGVSDQVLSLPSGGGALTGTGGKQMTDLQTGAANHSVRIDVPEGRKGMQPSLSLSYSSGNGHGIAGMGWSLGEATISRKTSDGVPVYEDDADDFLLRGSAELVAVDEWTDDDGTAVTRYRPRSDARFARITHRVNGDTDHWVVESRDGSVSYYGTPDSRGQDPAAVADPDDREKVFAWSLTATEDEFGNRIEYEYRRDSGETESHHWDHLFLDRIRYVGYEDGAETGFLVSVAFEYEPRPDPNSTYTAGFEQRSRERLSRIAVRTHADRDRTIRSYELTYREELPGEELPANGTSQLARIEIEGHDDGETERLPPMTFDYSRFDPGERTFRELSGTVPRRSLAAPELELADLSGDGLPDIVEIDDGIRYWENLGDGEFAEAQPMERAPSGLSLSDPAVQLMDADGDGRIDLVSFDDRVAGYFPLTRDGGWSRESFRAYDRVPTVDLASPAVQLLDLDGDGVTDMLRSGGSLQYFFQDPDGGWDEVRTDPATALDDLDGLDFADPRVRIADLSGDGLGDVVVLGDGYVSYWPNLGHGDWGRRVRMANPPDLPRDYDPSRLTVGDVDGDGLADILYVADDSVSLWLNRCGNGWSDPIVVDGTPSVTNTDAVRLVDVTGTGIGGLLYSDGSGSGEMYYLDLVGGQKPYLLTERRNGIGSSVRLQYAPSTRFSLDDRREGDGWKTSLPQPTWVVTKEEAIDRVTDRKLTSRYRYHHGYWDGVEREFRGFGMVETRDTESFESYNSEGLHDDTEFVAVADREQFSPPTLTKTWFHVGPVGGEHGDWRELDFGDEYWAGDPGQLTRPEETQRLLARLDRRDRRDAVRTLAGNELRREVYALDGSRREDRPYRVTERQYGVRDERPPPEAQPDGPPVFFPHLRGRRGTDWERGDDPMTRFAFLWDYDAHGQARTELSVACPRGWRHSGTTTTGDYQASYSKRRYAEGHDDRYMVDRLVEERSYAVVDRTERTVEELRAAVEAGTVPARLTGLTYHYYDGPAFEGNPRGVLGAYGARVRTEELVVTDELLRRAYPNRSEPPDTEGVPPYLATGMPSWGGEYPAAFRESVPQRAGYVTHDVTAEAGVSNATTGYFAITKQTEYDFQTDSLAGERGLVRRQRDPLDRETTIVEYDSYGLNPLATEDPAGLRTEAAYDYAAMEYWQVTDPNGNRSQVRFSPLGRVTARMELGDPEKAEGDTPAQPSVEYEYDFHAFEDGADDAVTPAYVHEVRRKRHRWDLVEERNEQRAADGREPLSDAEVEALFENEREDHPDRFVQQRTYLDGHGTPIQTRGQAEQEVFTDGTDGPVLPSAIADDPATTVVGEPATDGQRVRVSEWRTHDNKGNVVESFEPFYDTGWAFTSRKQAERNRPEAFERKTTVHYDALDRESRITKPDGAETRVVRGDPSPDLSNPDSFEPTPWETYRYDEVDNAGRTHATEAASYDHRWNTPTSTHIDIGEQKRTTVTRNRKPGETAVKERRTSVRYDPRTHELTATDELGRETLTTLTDLTGETLRIDSLDGGTSWQSYDAAGTSLEQRDAKGALRLQAVDERGRPTHTWARDGATGSVTLRQRIRYGEDTSRDRSSAADRNLLGNLSELYDESGLVGVDAYDFKNNPESVRMELLADDVVAGPPVDWGTDAAETLSDRQGAILSGRSYRLGFEHDALGRLQVQRYPADVHGREMEVQMEYTPSGSLDGAELVVNPGESDETRERYLEAVGRDGKERPVVMAYGNGVLVRSAYDEATERLQRQRVETYSEGSAAPETTRLQTTGTVHRDVGYTYDVGGNVLESREAVRGVGIAGSPQHRFHGQRAVHGRDTLVRSFQYDAAGRLARATGRECTTVDQSRRWGEQQPCGYEDFEGTPTVDRSNAPDQTATYTEAYEYDPAGNLTSLQHTRHGNGGQGSWTRYFGYGGEPPADWNPSPGGASSDPTRLTHVGDKDPAVTSPTHEYDAAGNLLAERNARYEWDHADRLAGYKEVKNGSVSVDAAYAYAAGGRRAKKVVDKGANRREVIEYVGGLFEYHRLETGRTASDGGTVKENNTIEVAGVARKRVGTPFDGEATFENSDRPAVEYDYDDRTDGASLVVDGDGTWTNREEFTPFGESTFGGYERKRYRYRGSERDEESALYYQGARYYAPWLCRWTTTDPAGPQDGLNLYAYVRNDPVNRTDPSGTQSDRKEKDNEVVVDESLDPPKKENNDNDLIVHKEGSAVIEGKKVTGGYYKLKGHALGKDDKYQGHAVEAPAELFEAKGSTSVTTTASKSTAATSDSESKEPSKGDSKQSSKTPSKPADTSQSGGSKQSSSSGGGGSGTASKPPEKNATQPPKSAVSKPGSTPGSDSSGSGSSGGQGETSTSGDRGSGGGNDDSDDGSDGSSDDKQKQKQKQNQSTDEWNITGTGLGMVAYGAIAIGFAAATIASGGTVGILAGLGAAMGLATGIPAVTMGGVQMAASVPASDEEERRMNRQFDEATSIAFGVSGSPGGAIGGMTGLLITGDVSGLKTGATIGSLSQGSAELLESGSKGISRQLMKSELPEQAEQLPSKTKLETFNDFVPPTYNVITGAHSLQKSKNKQK